MRKKYTEYIKILLSAVGIALLLNLEIELLSKNLSLLLEWVRVTSAILTPIGIIVLAWLLWRLIVPNRIERKAAFSIYYDINEGEVIPFMFESPFLPQDTARQVLKTLVDRQHGYKAALKEDLGQRFHEYYERRRKGYQLRENDRPFWSYVIEYLLLAWTKGWALHFAQAQRQHLLKIDDVTYSKLPSRLQANPLLRFLANLTPKGIIEASHSQLVFPLPADFRLEYSCPLDNPRMKPEYLDVGILRMKNRYLTVSMTFHGLHSWGLVSTFYSGPPTTFAGIPVSSPYSSYFESRLPYLRRVTFGAELKVDFSIPHQMFGRTGRAYYGAFEKIASEFTDNFDESMYVARAVAVRRDRLWDQLAKISQLLTDKQITGSMNSTSGLDERHSQTPRSNGTDDVPD